MLSKQIEEYVLEHPPISAGDYEKLATKLGTHPENIRYYCRKHGITLKRNMEKIYSNEVDDAFMYAGRYTVEGYANELIKKLNKKVLSPYDIINKPIISKTSGDEKEMTLILSDWQLGHKTKTFNYAIAKKRVIKLIEDVQKIVASERQSNKITKINICLLGDFVQNETVGYFVDLSELESILIDQVFSHAIPLLSLVIAEMGKIFSNVSVYSVRGNHGKGTKQNSEKTNWDDVIYRTLDIKFAESKHINIILTEDFYKIMKVFKWNFLLAHGDQVRGGASGVPLNSILRRMLQWTSSIPEKWDVLCVDTETEILTKHGWKKYNEIKEGDKIYNLNPTTDKIEINNINKVIKKQYNGDMYHFKSQRMDMLLSPEHRVFYQHGNSKKYLIKEAKDVYEMNSPLKIPVAGVMNVKNNKYTDDEIRLVAWIITEGCFKNQQHKYSIKISQKKGEKSNMIKCVLDNLKINYSMHKSGYDHVDVYYIKASSGKKIRENLVSEKRIPDFIYNLGSRQFDIFLNTMILGDGSGKRYYSGDEMLIDQLQLALTIHGYRTIKGYKNGGFKNGCWHLSIHKSKTREYQIRKSPIKKKKYNGIIWCVNTDNGTFIARRNGKVFITGNCVGHWHCFSFTDQNKKSLIVNGTLVSDDDYVRKTYGWESSTMQVLCTSTNTKLIDNLYRLEF